MSSFQERMLYTIKSLANSRQAAADLKTWFETTTIDDVYEQFLRVAIRPCPDMQTVPYDLLTPLELRSFNATISTFHHTSDGEIELSNIFSFLSRAYPSLAPRIQAARPCLAALLYAHARFPFSKPVPVTRDALLRAVLLLTQRGADFFSKQAISPPRRGAHDRLTYIFKALATPRAGQGLVEQEAIVEVLTRLPFPLPSNPKRKPGKPRDYFTRMAERLDPPRSEGMDGLWMLPSEHFGALAQLVAYSPGKPTEDFLVPSAGINLVQFLAWADEAQVLQALDQLFNSMLQPSHDA